MRVLLLLLSFLVAVGNASTDTPLHPIGSDITDPPEVCDGFYCQDPDLMAVYNMSTGFDSEIADDIPDELVGHTISQVTLWVGEWSAGWQDPDGVTVNFYNSACPPAMVPTLSFMIPWNEWETELVYDGYAMVYQSTATLPQPVEIVPGMSIGGYVNISWGPDEPFAGLCATPEWANTGCGDAYLDADNWGYPRWTPISYYTGIPRDFAFCFSEETNDVPTLSEWGMIILTLLLLATGTAAVVRRGKTAVSKAA